MDREHLIQSFKEFTGYTDDEEVRRLLAHCGWDVEKAINLHFMRNSSKEERRDFGEEDEGEVVFTAHNVQQQRQQNEQRQQQQYGFWNSKPRHRVSHFTNNQRIAEEQRRTAAAKQQIQRADQLDDSIQILDDNNGTDFQMMEDNGTNKTLISSAEGSSVATASKEEQVRAPIEPVRGVLVGETFRQTYQKPERLLNPVFEQYRHDQPSSSGLSTGAASDSYSRNHVHRSISERFVQKKAFAQPNSSEGVSFNITRRMPHGEAPPILSRHQEELRTIFRPPVELMFPGDWDQALQAARQKGIWLLVNVQDVSDFACAVLNRDIWSSEMVRDVIRSNFLFWQVRHDSADGTRVQGYYGFTTYPVIFIVDPRTGEDVSGCLRAPDRASFLDSLTSFLDQNPTLEDRDKRIRENAMTYLTPSASNSSSQTHTLTPTKKRKQPGAGPGSESSSGLDDNDLLMEGEEEMNRQAKKIKRVVTITDEHITLPHSAGPSNSFGARPADELTSTNEWLEWTMTNEQRPNKLNGSNLNTVQMALRLPDGRREHICMWATAPLSALFSFLLSMGFAPAEHQVVLDYPRREYSLTAQNRRLSLQMAGFGAQEVVHVDRFKA